MSETLDAFFGPQIVKTKQDPGIYIQEKCSDCGQILGSKNPLYTLLIKGEKKPYCRECAIKRLPKPKKESQEEKTEEPQVTEENCINAKTVFRRETRW